MTPSELFLTTLRDLLPVPVQLEPFEETGDERLAVSISPGVPVKAYGNQVLYYEHTADLSLQLTRTDDLHKRLDDYSQKLHNLTVPGVSELHLTSSEDIINGVDNPVTRLFNYSFWITKD